MPAFPTTSASSPWKRNIRCNLLRLTGRRSVFSKGRRFDLFLSSISSFSVYPLIVLGDHVRSLARKRGLHDPRASRLVSFLVLLVVLASGLSLVSSGSAIADAGACRPAGYCLNDRGLPSREPARATILPSAWLNLVIVAVADGMKTDIATINVAISRLLNSAGLGS